MPLHLQLNQCGGLAESKKDYDHDILVCTKPRTTASGRLAGSKMISLLKSKMFLKSSFGVDVKVHISPHHL